ncbi:DUF6049 family protein [Janibacter alittae]|uniref:DUF6049 family protein n=1 Tax=Janibacter alittae TaxID=3115209 RepID=A0ABZ2MH96_9MICO
MAAARRRRLRPTSIALLLLAMLVLPSAAATSLPPGEDSTGGELTIASITPVVDGEGTARVEGELTNTGEQALAAQEVSLVGRTASADRDDIVTWAEGTQPVAKDPRATVTLEDLDPGESAPFTLEVTADELAPGLTAGAAWVSVQTSQTAVHTFIGVHRAKEYVPMGMVWGVPLLLPADERLFGEPGPDRVQAWKETVGPESRLWQLTEEPPAEDETWILDPSLLSLPPEPTEDTGQNLTRALNAEREVRAEWASRVRSTLDPEQTIVLPSGDADVAAAARWQDVAELVAPQVEEGVRSADLLDDSHGDIQWPADGVVTESRTTALGRLQPGSTPPTVLTDTSAIAPGGFTPTGATRTTHGSGLLVADHSLSTLAGELTSPSDATLARQRIVAETSVLLGERPGTPRTLLVVPARASSPSPEAYADLRGVVDEIPWLDRGRFDDLLDGVDRAQQTAVPRTTQQIARATDEKPVPPVLTPTSATRIAEDRRSMSIFASVRSDGEVWKEAVDPALDQLTSARWRSDTAAFDALHDQLATEVTLSHDDLVVSSGEVNFFADKGRLQITIINKTDVRLTNLDVRVESQNPSFRIQEPSKPVTIGPDGRQKVTVQATALAAGRTPVHVVVTTPNGHELTEQATLEVRMRPTGETVYWAIGGIAVVLLGVGTWRSLRRRTRTTVNEDSA